ncbi:MAG: type I methionyl aminopeptidase [Deltaproteobacteria bacterium]|nr:type I methionyl aminopeptidase [Deltaproteobacteria bacterium]
MSRQMEYLSDRGREKMRVAGRMAADLLHHLEKMVAPGISTADLDEEAERWTQERGAISAPLGYPYGLKDPRSFQKSICTSVNEVVCHGIPNAKHVLKDGDIINIDVTPIVDGYHGDTSKTFFVGQPSDEVRKLVEVTEACLRDGIRQVKPGGRLRDIGVAIQKRAEAEGFSVVRDFVGHGIGRVFHAEPQVKHYDDKLDRKGRLRFKPNMCFTIEPMINLGTWKCDVLDDNWTAVTTDARFSAQFEHTLCVTKDGVEIFTLREDETYDLT